MPESEICYICKKEITEDKANCAYCNTPYHKKELNNWIKRFKKCPRCGRELKEFVIM